MLVFRLVFYLAVFTRLFIRCFEIFDTILYSKVSLKCTKSYGVHGY